MLIERLCRKDKGIMRAEMEAAKVLKDMKRYSRKMGQIKNDVERYYRDVRSREEGKKEVARNALDKGYSFEQIHEITGLDMETIANLKDGV